MKLTKTQIKQLIKEELARGIPDYAFDEPANEALRLLAFIPQGNKRKAEYYLFGIKYTKEQWLDFKKESNGIPFYKTSAGRAAGVRV